MKLLTTKSNILTDYSLILTIPKFVDLNSIRFFYKVFILYSERHEEVHYGVTTGFKMFPLRFFKVYSSDVPSISNLLEVPFDNFRDGNWNINNLSEYYISFYYTESKQKKIRLK